MLYATLILEREPLQWYELPQGIFNWFASAGAIASIGLFLVFALPGAFSFRRLFAPEGSKTSKTLVGIGAICSILSWFGYLLVGFLFLGALIGIRSAEGMLPGVSQRGLTIGDLICAAAGAFAIAVVAFPVLRACVFDVKMRRIWAVAKLSIKESIRNGSVAVFGVVAIIFLFADWFIPYKPEDQVRNYVWVLYWTMMVLFLLSAGIFGSFSIPLDIKNQTIHTVVTKPITKFEVVLGRFLGYAVLLTVGLFAVGALSLGYIVRGVTQEAQIESFQARVPVYGYLRFVNTNREGGDSVGREWDYRRYISGQTMSQQGKKQYAVWMLPSLDGIEPRGGGAVRLEYGFDIFRLTKGKENEDIKCTFKFAPGDATIELVDGQLQQRQREFDERRTKARQEAGVSGDPIKIAAKIEEQLIKDFPVFQLSGVQVTDYHTQSIEIPYALIERLRDIYASAPSANGQKPPAMQIFVSIDSDPASAAQMLGVAPRDLYILAAEKNFYVNFLKGLIGLWMCVILVLGVAICCSTYLSGVISLLCTMFLLLGGFFMPSIMQMANNQSVGGGPAESLKRIVDRSNLVTPLEDSPSTTVIRRFDDGFRWIMRRVLTIIPDASRYDLHVYVANGFDVSPSEILFLDELVPLLAYLLPWFVLAFYMINYREIANPT